MSAGTDHARDQAERLRILGVEATANGRPEEGAAHLESALNLLGPTPAPSSVRLQARVLIALAMCEFERHGLGPCEATLQRAVDAASSLAPPDGREEVLALSHSQRANVWGRSGRLVDALTELDEAVRYLAALAPRDRWVVLLNRGMARGQHGDLVAAAADLAAAAEVAERAGLTVECFVAAHDQGWLCYLGGDLPAALAQMESAAEAAPGVADGMALLDRGRVLLEAGLLDEAVPMLEQAVTACAGNQQGHSVVEATFELARAELLRGEHTRALTLAERTEGIARDRGASSWAARAALVRLRLHLRSAHAPRHARAAAQECADIAADATVDPIVRHASWVVRGEALSQMGDDTGAREALRCADEVVASRAAPHLSTRLERLRAEALVASRAHQDDEVRQVLRRAVAELRGGSTVSTLDLVTARAAHATALADIDVAMALSQGPAALLGAAERWRLATARRGTARPHPSPVVAERLAEVRRLSEVVREDGTEAALSRLTEAERRAAAAVRGLAPRESGADAVAPGPEELDLEELVEALVEDGSDLLTTLQHDGVLWGVGVVDGQPRRRALGEVGELAEASRRVRRDLHVLGRYGSGQVAAAVAASLAEGVGRLRRTLVEEFCPGSQRLVVVPDSTLAGLPWSMIANGRPICVAPSATWWRRSREPGPLLQELHVGVLTGPRLVGAATEAASIRAAWHLAGGPDAELSTVADLHAALREDDLVHIAAHGHHHVQNPMFSSVSLVDGPAFLYDLEATEVSAGHVVLAACDVGRSAVRPGDVMLGLAAGLLSLGSRSVLAATCPVPDDMALDTMPEYHARLAAGSPSDIALADTLVTAPPLAGAFAIYGSAWAVRVGSVRTGAAR